MKMTTIRYEPGDVIMKVQPLVYVVTQILKGKICDFCLMKNSKLKKCAQCLSMWYCNDVCQKQDWINHKSECQVYQNHTFQTKYKDGPDFIRLFIRLWLIKCNNQHFLHLQYKLPNGKFMKFQDLKPNIDLMENDENKIKSFQVIFDMFKQIQCMRYSRKSLFKLYGTIINTHFITVHDVMGISFNLALAFSVQIASLQHSCAPNTVLVSDGIQTKVIAMTSISINEEMTMNEEMIMNKEMGMNKEMAMNKEMGMNKEMAMNKEIGMNKEMAMNKEMGMNKKLIISEELTINRIKISMNKIERKEKIRKLFLIDCVCARCKSELDDKVDFEKLKQLTSKLLDMTKKSKMNWIKLHEIYVEKYLIIEQIYWYYHPEKSEFLFNFFCNKIHAKRNIQEIGLLGHKLYEHLIITHGKDHPLFIKFMELLKIYQIDIKNSDDQIHDP